MENQEMCVCGQDTVYSKALTAGLCLNCFQDLQKERKLMEVECRLDDLDAMKL